MNTEHVIAGRPAAEEYAPYFGRYISLIKDEDILAKLQKQWGETTAMLRSLSEKDGGLRYAPDKWSAKEVVGHVNDTERIFAYRALRIARSDKTPLAGFEQDDYVRGGNFSGRTLVELAEEFGPVRMATVAFFKSLQKEAWQRRGTANGKEVTVRALAFIVAGHELHHRLILEERYFPAIPRA